MKGLIYIIGVMALIGLAFEGSRVVLFLLNQPSDLAFLGGMVGLVVFIYIVVSLLVSAGLHTLKELDKWERD